jgi:hypothetical protein
MMDERRLIVLRNCGDELQAELIRGILESAGIQSMLRRGLHPLTAPYGELPRGVDVMILPEDRQEALEVLEAHGA